MNCELFRTLHAPGKPHQAFTAVKKTVYNHVSSEPNSALHVNTQGMFFTFLKAMFTDFKERGGENYPCKRETLMGCLPHAAPLGIEPPTQTCALTTIDAPNIWSVGQPSNALSRTGQGKASFFFFFKDFIYLF